MPPYIEIDVDICPNTDFPALKVVHSTDEPWEVTQVVAPLPDGTLGSCSVTGWDDKGPVVAYAVNVFDSGEGTVLLIYGGEHGIRLKASDSIEPWSVNSSTQWGEPCLLLPAGTATNNFENL